MFVQTAYLKCDAPECGQTFSNRHVITADTIREWAEQKGWQRHYEGGKAFDFCPQHKRHAIAATRVPRS